MDDPSLRVSDADREQAVSALREHLLAGRLTLEEFSDRVGAALQARVGTDLARVQAGLPAVTAGAVPPGRPRLRPARWSVALLAHVERRGQMRLRGRTTAVSVLGDLDLDLRQARVDHRETVITVLALLGNVDIYVPDGVNADVSGIAVLGHLRQRGRAPGRADAPSIHVRVLGWCGTIDVWHVPRDLRGGSYSEIFRQVAGPKPAPPPGLGR
jgi:Domain of unknown function (DUF1707)/Cell wall-active antibiotics response 4TMS YvqF